MFFIVIPTLIPFLSSDEHVLTTITLVYLGGNMLGRALPQFINSKRLWPTTIIQFITLSMLIISAMLKELFFNDWLLLPVKMNQFIFKN